MSAVNMNVSDREHDALRRAQRAHEPSMEEILASIRTIISEEREPAKASGPKGAQARPAAPSAPPQIVYSKAEAAPQESGAPAQSAEPATEVTAPRVVWRQAEAEASESPKPPAEDDAPLLSPETDKAIVSAFDELSANLAARSAELTENLVREMLRPMLKGWLDENLPAIVERLVRAEIERVSRGTR